MVDVYRATQKIVPRLVQFIGGFTVFLKNFGGFAVSDTHFDCQCKSPENEDSKKEGFWLSRNSPKYSAARQVQENTKTQKENSANEYAIVQKSKMCR